MKTPECVNCRNTAVIPLNYKDEGFAGPLFCSSKCVMEYVLDQETDRVICPVCGQWSDRDGYFGCECTESSNEIPL